MIKLDLLKHIGVNLSKTDFNGSTLIKVEKLLLAEIQINPDINRQDIIELLAFLKSDWQIYKPILLNWNIQSFLFNNREYKIYKCLIITKRTEELNVFFRKYFLENIETSINTLMRENNWFQLIDLWNNYPFLFPIDYLENELDKKLEDVFYNVKRKKVPLKFKEHYSTQENFFFFLYNVNETRYDYEIDDLLNETRKQLKKDLKARDKDYLKAVKSATLYSNHNGADTTSLVFFAILGTSVILLTYLMYLKSVPLLKFHYILVLIFTRIEKWSKYIEGEMIYYDGSISLKQFKLRKSINYFALMFYSSFVISLIFWIYAIFF